MALSDAQLLTFLIEFLLLLALARGCGGLVRRAGQPAVIGELAAGVLLGPTLFGGLLPSAFRTLFPTSGAQPLLLQLLAQLGVILLLLTSGLEVDLDLIRRRARPAVLVAIGGMAIPFLAGYGLALLLQGRSAGLIGGSASPGLFSLFVATAMSITAIPVIV
jgi:Kef-type K+ transport system membrane component KefB